MTGRTVFASLIIEGRKKRCIGLRAAAAEAGISPATLCRVESGKLPDVITFRALVRAWNLEPGRALAALDRFEGDPVGLESSPISEDGHV